MDLTQALHALTTHMSVILSGVRRQPNVVERPRSCLDLTRQIYISTIGRRGASCRDSTPFPARQKPQASSHLTLSHISAIIEICTASSPPTRSPVTRICSRPWAPKPACALCNSCCRRIPRALWSAKSSRNSTSPIPLSPTISTNCATKTSSASPARVRSFATPPIPRRSKRSCVSSTPSAARAIRPCVLATSCRLRNRRPAMPDTASTPDIKQVAKEKYGQAALRVKNSGSTCCGATPASDSCCDPITTNLYDPAQTAQIPQEALLASLGCGNPTALAQLHAGEVVLDLGSGGGIDVLLSARRVGPTGKAYGLDMTDEMLALANQNKRTSGLTNVEFLKGEIENIPLPDNSVDVIISNCVINLSADKDRVLREAFRVLKPGGRFAVSDVVTRGDIAPAIRQSVLLWVGCVAGALDENDYKSKLSVAGFQQIEIEPTRVYRVEDAREFLSGHGLDLDALAPEADEKFMSAFVRAVKPAGPPLKNSPAEPASCCDPTCCSS